LLCRNAIARARISESSRYNACHDTECRATLHACPTPITFRSESSILRPRSIGRNLPHWFQPGVATFITFRTADSLPRAVIARWQAEQKDWLRRHGFPITNASLEAGSADLPPSLRKAFRRTVTNAGTGTWIAVTVSACCGGGDSRRSLETRCATLTAIGTTSTALSSCRTTCMFSCSFAAPPIVGDNAPVGCGTRLVRSINVSAGRVSSGKANRSIIWSGSKNSSGIFRVTSNRILRRRDFSQGSICCGSANVARHSVS